MRVISQWKDVDVDYETSSFIIADSTTEQDDIEESVLENSAKYLILGIAQTGHRFAMAAYSTIEKAQKALTDMSNNYIRYLITDTNGYMSMTDALECDLDKPFNRIEIKEMKATVYQFPKEEEIHE